MPTNGSAVWLYGSHARGNQDSASDIDVLVISEEDSIPKEVESLYNLSDGETAFSRYSWEEIEEMAGYGSLYLHHIKLEGRPVAESDSCKGRLSKILRGMPEYKNVRKDLHAFKYVLEDISETSSNSSIIFDLSVLAMLVRHVCILGCWQIGAPVFTRQDPVNKIVDYFKLDTKISSEFADLYKYRMYADDRVSKVALPNSPKVTVWLKRCWVILEMLEGYEQRKN